MRASIPLPADPSTAAVARRFVREALGRWRLDRLEPDASLLATELVTNGLRYGGGARSMTLRTRRGRLRIEVADRDPWRSPRLRTPSPTAEGGRGLALVEEVATEWGTRRSRVHRGKVVWCELGL
jgi:anti-sigma regulatory factor (Ser/Thr protein kinase)